MSQKGNVLALNLTKIICEGYLRDSILHLWPNLLLHCPSNGLFGGKTCSIFKVNALA